MNVQAKSQRIATLQTYIKIITTKQIRGFPGDRNKALDRFQMELEALKQC